MDKPLNHYWNIRLADLKSALETNNFEVHIAETAADAQKIVLDMLGNRVAALTFGPKQVAVVIGRNKIVPSVDEAIFRVKNIAAPANAMRLDKKTPCVKTSYCEECKSPERICNSWTITEKSFPKGRVKVVLVNQDLGL